MAAEIQGALALELAAPLLRDAVDMQRAGFASTADIDLAMRLGAGHHVGPLAVVALIPRQVLGGGAKFVDLINDVLPFGPTRDAISGALTSNGTWALLHLLVLALIYGALAALALRRVHD